MTAANHLPTLDQRRAGHAWKQLQAFKDATRDGDDARKKYGRHVRKLPVRIMASGLGQAMAFLLAKNYCPQLLAALGDWVLDKRLRPDSKQPLPEPRKLLQDLIERDSEFAQLATAEVLAYLKWLTRFAEAEKLTGDDETED